MPIPDPQFDSRTYREILDESLARIPVHNPEWKNFHDSDPGITLLQLFAFMTESLIYRANLIPERNRRKYLRLLGIPMRAAAAAQGFVTFTNRRGSLDVTTLESDREVQAGRTPFRTQNGLDVLPIEGKVFFKSPIPESRQTEIAALYERLYASFATDPTGLAYYETQVLEPPLSGNALPVLDLGADTQDGVAWLALLARPREDVELAREAIANKVLSLGIVPAVTEEGCAAHPASAAPATSTSSLVFELPNTADKSARYERLRVSADADPLTSPARLDVHLPQAGKLTYWDSLLPIEAGVGNFPPSLEETDDADRLITWIRIRAESDGTEAAPTRQLTARLSWLGINAARVVQRAHVEGEILAAGTGEPDQSATLANTPVLADTVRLTVNGEPWTRIDDLFAAPPEVPSGPPGVASVPLATGDEACRQVPTLAPQSTHGTAEPEASDPKVFTVDRESGEIRFGNGARGMRPPEGATLIASYDYGGGLAGMVGIDAIKKAPGLDSGIKVTNPVPTWGGDEAETTEEAEHNIPSTLRHRERLVSVDDTLEITWRTPGVDLGRVEVRPTLHPQLPNQVSEGVVTVIVIPKRDPVHPDAPRPDRLFLETVCRYLEPRRVLTTELHVVGPEYKQIWVSVGIDVVPGFELPPVREAVEAKIRSFLSSLTGGFDETGWPLGRAVEAAEILAAATRVAGVAKVNTLRLGDDSSTEVETIGLAPLELPELVNAVVESGDAPTLDQVQGLVTGPEPEESFVPVPVVPEEC